MARRPVFVGALLLALTLPCTAAGQSGAPVVAIEHEPVGCLIAERFPRLEAAVGPADEVGRVRLRFRPEGFEGWYSVAMKQEGAVFAAVLPKPKKSLKGLDYYIEATDRAFATSRTPDYRAQVVSGAVACEQGKMLGGSVGTASIVLEIPAGAPGVPPGFASTGGIGATTLVLGGVAAVSAGAAVAAASAGGGDGTTTPISTPPRATACSGSLASPTTYSMSGSTSNPQTSLNVDDTLRVVLDGRVIHDVGQFLSVDNACCTWPSFSFEGSSNGQLTVVLSNGGGPFGLDSELVVWRSDGCFQLLLRPGDAPSCCHPSEICGGTQTEMARACAQGVYLTRPFTLP